MEPLSWYLQISTLREACILVQKAGTPPGCVNPEQKIRGLQRYKPPQYMSFLLPKDYLQDKNLPQINKTLTLHLLKCNSEKRAFHLYIHKHMHTHTDKWSTLLFPLHFIYIFTQIYTHAHIYFRHACMYIYVYYLFLKQMMISHQYLGKYTAKTSV